MNPMNCCSNPLDCCKVEAVISVDERGQTVLPKEVRDKIGITPGDKLAVISLEKLHGCSCLVLIKTEDLEKKVKDILGPLMKDAAK